MLEYALAGVVQAIPGKKRITWYLDQNGSEKTFCDKIQIWIKVKFTNRKGAWWMRSVNVEIVVQLSKDLSGELKFGLGIIYT